MISTDRHGPGVRRRPTVEESLTLDVDQLVRRGVLSPGARTRGVIAWNDAATGQVISSISYEADMTDRSAAHLRLRFTITAATRDRRRVEQQLAITSTRPRFGGARWWFVDDGERVGRLHLPPSGDQFRSRRAHALVYASQRAV